MQQLKDGIPPNRVKFSIDGLHIVEEKGAALPTFEDAALGWLENYARRVKPEVILRHRGRYEGYLKGPLGSRPIAELTKKDLVVAAESPLEKSVSGRGAKTVPHRLAQMIVMIFDWARLQGIVRDDYFPDAHLPELLPDEPPAEHRPAITDPGDLGLLLRRIHGWFPRCQVPQSGLALRLAPYVALRPEELTGALWEEINIGKAIWTIPAARMKMKKPLLIPLSRQVIEILNLSKEFSKDSKFIFFSKRSKKYGHISKNTLLKALQKLGYNTYIDVYMHGFRTTFSSLLNEYVVFNKDAIERQLAHMNKIRGIYNISKYLEERTEMMQLWADYLDALREGPAVSLKEWAKSRAGDADA